MDAPVDSILAEPDRRFELSSSIAHPGVFVSDFYVLRSLEKPGEQIQRHVQLRRGLNILWADPNPPEKAATGKRSKVAGHTAGKSTFCRLLRYALGDVGFGSDGQEGKVVEKFKDGWVVLRVELNGCPWIIGRAFIDKHQRFSVQHGDIDRFLREGIESFSGYPDFEAALHALFVRPLITQKFPGHRGDIHWRHLIPWFTRDQEARLLSLTTWRAPVGKTHAVNTDVDERQFLMRLVLGLLPKGEANEFDRHEKLNETKRELDRELPLTQARTEQAFAQLSEWIDVQAQGLEGPLYFDAAKATHDAKARELNELRTAVPPEGDVQHLQDAWRQAGRNTAQRASEMRAAQRRLKDLEKDIAGCDAQRIKQVAALEDLKRLPPASVCGVPIAEACEAGKRHQANRPTVAAYAAILANIDEAKAQLGRDVDAAQSEIDAAKVAVAEAENAERLAQAAYLELSSRRTKAYEIYVQAKAEHLAQERVLNSTHKILKKRMAGEELLAGTTKDIDKSAEQEAKERKESERDRSHFSMLYQRLLRHMLGEEVTGAVQHSGRALVVTAEGRNDLDSGAITAAKLISFDIAAMAWSMEGRGHHPRFVIHDSPREADMAEDIYAGLFEAALALESQFQPGTEASFQYIVTTTARPPEAFNGRPWRLDPVLNALVPSQRILGVDL